MVEKFKSKRVKFPKGKQRAFLTKAKNRLGLNNKNLAELLKINIRTLTDWKREKFSMSLEAVKLLFKKTQIKTPRKIKILDPFWYTKRGSSAGGIAVYKKYGYVGGDPEIRKRKWCEWWEKEGRFKPHPIINVALSVRKPPKSSDLAEFIGIMLGDGGLSKRQLRITLNYFDDKKYGKFVIKLIKKLFHITPSVYLDLKDSVFDIAVSRSELVKFCAEKLGLKIGNKIKQQIDIPIWIKRNRKFQVACVRGLVDTDGSIFTHTYKVNGKWYRYKKLAFTSRSQPLILSVYRILRRIGLNPRLAQKGRDVRLDSIEDMKKYFNIINSHNPKHLKRYKNYDTK